MSEEVVVEIKPDDFIQDREFWLSRVWDAATSFDYCVMKTKQLLGIL